MGLSDVLGLNGNVLNSSNASIIGSLPGEVISKVEGLITVLRVAGIIFIAYIVFLIIRWFFGIRRHRKINKIYKKVNIVDKKLDVLLGKKRLEELEKVVETKKEKKPEKKEKISFFGFGKKQKKKK
jgi:hypothetical protein